MNDSLMRLFAAVAMLAGCRDVSRGPGVDAVTGDFRVAAFNVRRFFDTVCDTGACDIDDYEALPSQQAFEDRAAQLATAIRALDADVVSLQEIETQACLDALLARVGDAMPYGLLGEIGSTASVDVAILSKTPFDRVIRHRATEPLTNFSRELLETHVHGGDVVLFAAHFKSKANDDPARRLAEAQTSSRLVNEVAGSEPTALVVLAGDLNDTPGSPPLDALMIDGGLVRVADDLSLAAQATYEYAGTGQAIDHILIAPSGAAYRVPRSSMVWRGTPGWGGSDHAALTSDFVLGR